MAMFNNQMVTLSSSDFCMAIVLITVFADFCN